MCLGFPYVNRCYISLFWSGAFLLDHVFYSEHLCSHHPSQSRRLQTSNQIPPYTVCIVLAWARNHCGRLSLLRSSRIQVSLCRSYDRWPRKHSNGLLCCHATHAGHARSVTVLTVVHCVVSQKGTKYFSNESE